jgi:hypothetical protein
MEMPMSAQEPEPILIKPPLRPCKKRYVTVCQLREWAAKGIPFLVQDGETGADITQVLIA